MSLVKAPSCLRAKLCQYALTVQNRVNSGKLGVNDSVRWLIIQKGLEYTRGFTFIFGSCTWGTVTASTKGENDAWPCFLLFPPLCSDKGPFSSLWLNGQPDDSRNLNTDTENSGNKVYGRWLRRAHLLCQNKKVWEDLGRWVMFLTGDVLTGPTLCKHLNNIHSIHWTIDYCNYPLHKQSPSQVLWERDLLLERKRSNKATFGGDQFQCRMVSLFFWLNNLQDWLLTYIYYISINHNHLFI